MFSLVYYLYGQAQTIGDLSISQALGLAKDQFFKSLISGSSKSGGGNN